MDTFNISHRVYRQFFTRLGFDDDPFAHTNADEEDRLPDYFIPPPYFPAVFGNPNSPKSFVVFAPRGGGKSAQRIMIENACADGDVLAVTYDRFDFPDIKKASGVSLQNHLRSIIRCSLMGLLVTLSSDPPLKDKLSKYDREVMVKLARSHLAGINEQTLKRTLDSLKSLKDKVRDFWNEWLPAIGPGIEILLKTLLDIDIDPLGQYPSARDEDASHLKYQLETVISLAQKLTFTSIYVLVDRVDEAAITGNDAVASFELIRPLLKDLELLELRGIGLKFFLWDQLEPAYLDIARTDRIRQETLEWDDEMLGRLWKQRLLAYSGGRISSLDDIAEVAPRYLVDQLALVFANSSPRDMIRIGARIVAEQLEIDSSSDELSQSAVYRGVERFCNLRTSELVSTRTLHDLRRVQQVDFTIPYLANDIFREKQESTRNRISRWRREAAIADLERVDNPDPEKAWPVKLFAVSDIRIAKVMYPELTVPEFLAAKYRQCPRCSATVLRDWGDDDSLSICHTCQYDLNSGDDNWTLWRRRSAAAEYRRKTRRTTLSKYTQRSFLLDENTSFDEGESSSN